MTNTYRLEQKTTSYADIIWALDKYDEYGVLQVYTDDTEESDFESLAQELMSKHELKGIVIKFRKQEANEYFETTIGDVPEQSIEVIENDIKFIIHLRGKLDVGLFLDHEPARTLVASKSKGKTVLNLFSYTSSFSVYAAFNGAGSTTSVDLSKTYMDWSRENFKVNNIDISDKKHLFWKRDAIDFLRVAKKIGNQFDIVILDPPSFSRNKNEFFNVQEDHEELIRLIYDHILTDEGFLLFSNNFRDFELAASLEDISEEITNKTTPKEFSPYHPHRAFLFQK